MTSDREIKDNWLLIAVLVCILLFVCLASCTPATVPQPTERARSTQYQMKFIGSDALLFRNGKMVERKPSGIFTRDTVRTEIKTTTERY